MKLFSSTLALLLVFFFSFSQDTIQEVKTNLVKDVVPVELLFKKPQQHSYSISPDGKYFVEVLKNHEENDIIIIDIDEYLLYKRLPLGREKVQDVYWLTSNRLLYESYGELIAIDVDGQNKTTIASRLDELPKSFYKFYKEIKYNSVLSILPDNKYEILIETFDYEGYSTIEKVNVFTGEKHSIFNGKKHKFSKLIIDNSGKVRFGVKIKDTELIYYYRNMHSNTWEPFEIIFNKKSYPMVINAESYLNQNINFHGFGIDNNIIYLSTNIDSDKRKLISYNLSNNTVDQIILEDLNCDIYESDSNLSFIFDNNTEELSGVRYDCFTPQNKWFSIKYIEIENKLKIKFPGLINDIIDSDFKSNRFVIYQWSDNNQGNIGIYDYTDDSYAIMFHFNQELNKYYLTRTKSLSAKTRDNYKLPCYINLPLNYSKEKKYPLVVLPHGGPWARDFWGLDEFSQYFSTRDYITLRVNYRGSTGFGKSHVLAGVKSLDKLMIDDIADSVLFFSDVFSVDKSKIFIFGHSYGGYAAYMSLAKYPNLYASGVSLSAPSNIKDWLKVQKKEKNFFAYEFWTSALGSDKSKNLLEMSPVTHVDKISKPLLVFHGKKDEVVPLSHSQKMVSLLLKKGNKAKLEILQKEGHSITDGNSLSYILESAKLFFENSVK